MARKFSELWDRMPAEARARADQRTRAMLAEIERTSGLAAGPGQAVSQGITSKGIKGRARFQPGCMRIPKALQTRAGIREYAQRYDYDGNGYDPEEPVRQAAQLGYLTRADLIEVAGWKWRGSRTRDLCAENTEAQVRAASEAAFCAGSAEERIFALAGKPPSYPGLRGVGYPVASVILHFAYPDRYPILDKKTMQAVGGSTNYTPARWREYVTLCRDAAQHAGVSLRELDKALWVYGDG